MIKGNGGNRAAALINRRKVQRGRSPNGEWMSLVLVQVLDRDERGRVKGARFVYDDDSVTLGDLVPTAERDAPGGPKLEFLLLWIGDDQMKMAKGDKR